MRQRMRTLITVGLFLAVIASLSVTFFKENYAGIAYPPIPESHYKFINDAIRHCGVPTGKRGLIAAIAWKESTFHPNSQSGAGAVGVMQLLRGTGFGVANEYQIGGLNAATFTDPAISYMMGTCYYHSLVTRLGGIDSPEVWNNDRILRAALIGYNAGPARGSSYLSGAYSGPRSSLGYAERIMQAEKVYAFDFSRYDQRLATGEIDILGQVREIVWNVLLRQDSEPETSE